MKHHVRLTLGLLALLLTISPAAAQRSSTLNNNDFKNGSNVRQVFKQVIADARQSVVEVRMGDEVVAMGTIVDADGWILTKASELDADDLTCKLSDGTEIDVDTVIRDNENDVAMLKVSHEGLEAIAWSDAEPDVGMWAVTPGFSELPVAVGIVSVPPRKIRHRRAMIGVSLDMNDAKQATVAGVIVGLGAEAAGVEPGDVIIAVNDEKVTGREQLIATLREHREGDQVEVKLRRGDETLTKTIEMMVPKPQGIRGMFNRQRWQNRLGGPVSERNYGFEQVIQHDTVLRPEQCGGPLIGLDGKALGVNIARAGRVDSYALPADLVAELVDQMKAQAGEPVTTHGEDAEQPRREGAH